MWTGAVPGRLGGHGGQERPQWTDRRARAVTATGEVDSGRTTGQTVDSVHWTVYIGQCTWDSGQCTLDSGHWTVYIGQCTLDSGQCTLDSAQCTLDSEQCTLDIGHWTVYIGQWTVYIGQWTVDI